MISHLRVRNFQRHLSLRLRLDPHVTTLVGPSDVGKSAILRALRWLLQNKPRGVSFIRHGTNHVSVDLKVDGRRIRRNRHNTHNTYRLDGRRFQAFGAEVPKEIAEILNVSDLNFQSQIGTDPLFWFGLTPGEVSRELNSIVDLTLIDTTLHNLAAAHRKARVEREVTQSRLITAKKERDLLKNAKQADRALKRLERLQKRAALTARRAATLDDLVQQAQARKGEVRRLAQSRRLGRELRKLEKLASKLETLREHEQELAQLLSDAKKLKDAVADLKDGHGEAHRKLVMELGDVCPLCGAEVPLPF